MTVRNSVCSGGDGAGFYIEADTSDASATLIHVTSTGLGDLGRGLDAYTNTNHAFLTVVNSVFSGSWFDVNAVSLGGGSGMDMDAASSNYSTVESVGSNSIPPPGTEGNQTAIPQFLEDGYTQEWDSPTIDAGQPVEAGPEDIDGDARLFGAAPDIGADEAWNALRYASPTGTGTACSATNPCSVETAAEGASDGDEVIVAPGDYETPTISVDTDIYMHGVLGEPRPRVTSESVGLLQVNGAAAELRHLRLIATGGGTALYINVGDNTLVDRVIATAVSGTGCWIAHAWDVTVRNSVCSGGLDGAGVYIQAEYEQRPPPH